MLAIPIQWVLIRDPKGRLATQALLCNDLRAEVVQRDLLNTWADLLCYAA